MSSKRVLHKKAFKTSVQQSVRKYYGEDWSMCATDPESWSVSFIRQCDKFINVIHFTLSDKPSAIVVTLSVTQDKDVLLPKVWWDDRSKHAAKQGYSTVLWTGDIKYRLEVGSQSTKNFWSQQFSQDIDNLVDRTVSKALDWYRVVQAHLHNCGSV